MSIAATRFKSLDTNFNVPTLDFKSAVSSDVFNSQNTVVKNIDANLQSFLDNNQQVPKIDLGGLKDSVRSGKGALGTLNDLSKLGPKDLDKAIAGIIPNNPTAQNLFASMSDKCKKKGMNSGGLGKPYDPSLNCNSKSRKANNKSCSSASYGNVLNRMTNGAYSSSYQDLNNVLKSIIGLSNFGYDMNMCGVFGALSSGVDKGVLSRASGAILGHLGSTGNLLGVFDLANSSSGLHTLKENPNGLKSVFNGAVRIPEMKEVAYKDLSTSLVTVADAYDDKWNVGSLPGTLSTNFSDAHNPVISDLLNSKVLEVKTNPASLNTIPSSDLMFTTAAYDLKVPGVGSGLGNLGGLGNFGF